LRWGKSANGDERSDPVTGPTLDATVISEKLVAPLLLAAFTRAVPGPVAVIKPALLTVATALLDVDQATIPPSFVANCDVAPTVRFATAGDTANRMADAT